MGLKEVKQEIINEAKKKAEIINKQGLQERAEINQGGYTYESKSGLPPPAPPSIRKMENQMK